MHMHMRVQVDGLNNPLVQTVHLADCPIQQAAWASGGGQVSMQGCIIAEKAVIRIAI
jgi:hypothetical protein